MKVSKVIIIVVALHVLVIGGIFVFEGCSRSHVQAPDMAHEESTPGTLPADSATATPADMASATATNPAPAEAGAPAATSVAMAPATAPVAAAPAATTYTIKKGDSLWKIAKSEHISVAELTKANNMDTKSRLKVGQTLNVPAKNAAPASPAASTVASAAAPGAPASDSASYTVKSGDSLWKIARANKTTVLALKKANSLSSESLKVGQQLHLPSASATAAASTAAPTPAPEVRAALATTGYNAEWNQPGTSFSEGGKFYHVVDFNESLGSIAAKYGVSLGQLKSVNNLTSTIHPGQKLVIPSAPIAANAPTAPTAAVTPVRTTDASMAAPIVSAPATVN